MRRAVAAVTVAVALAACATTPPSPQASLALKIRTEPANSICLLARPGAPRVTLSLDPSKSDQIWAVADDGTKIPIEWPDRFRVGDSGGPVVLDVSGQVAGANGDVIVMPDKTMPTLRGRTVCFGSGTLSVMPTNIDATASPS
jgi:hypothetical protein